MAGRLFSTPPPPPPRPSEHQVIKLKNIPPKEQEACKNEVELLSRMCHPNIVGYTNSFLYKNCLCIIMEYCDAGDLGDRVNEAKVQIKSTGCPQQLQTLHVGRRKMFGCSCRSVNQWAFSDPRNVLDYATHRTSRPRATRALSNFFVVYTFDRCAGDPRRFAAHPRLFVSKHGSHCFRLNHFTRSWVAPVLSSALIPLKFDSKTSFPRPRVGPPQKGKLLPESKIMTWFVQTALGLHYMHSNRVLHRDIKTQNVFILSSGRVVLGDLGISKVGGQSQSA